MDGFPRLCDGCGVIDTEPHHVVYHIATDLVVGRRVDKSTTMHFACCALNGCDICAEKMEKLIWQTSSR